MSRSDYLIIGVVAICLVALIFLVYEFSQLNKSRERDIEEMPLYQSEDNLSSADMDTALYGEDYPEYEDTLVESYAPAPSPEASAPSSKTTVPSPKATAPSPKATAPSVQKVKEIPVPEETEFSETPSVAGGDYLVLAGAFRQQVNAESMLRQVRKKGYTQAEISLFNRGTYAAVLVDRFPTEQEANQLVRELKDKGIEAYVQKKRK